jgi:hypothetical protein
MGKLDAKLCGPRGAAKRGDAPKGCLAFVGIEAHAAMRDAAMAFDMGRLDDQEAGA